MQQINWWMAPCRALFSFVNRDVWDVRGCFASEDEAVINGRQFAQKWLEHPEHAPRLCEIWACVDDDDMSSSKSFAGFLDELDRVIREKGGAA